MKAGRSLVLALLVWEDLGSCESWTKTCYPSGKASVNSFGWPISWVGQSLRDFQGRANSVSRVVSLRFGTCRPALWLCEGRGQKRVNGQCLPLHLGGSCPPALALVLDTSVPPCMPLGPFKCYPCAGAQREWVWISLYVGSSRGTAWDFRSFFYWLTPSLCL